MTLILHLSPETEDRLKRWAALTGADAETVALEALREKLSDGDYPLSVSSTRREFEEWFASHPCSTTPALDDSRESIYRGRGE